MVIGFPASASPDEHSHIARIPDGSESTNPTAKCGRELPGTRLPPEKLRHGALSGRAHPPASCGRFPDSRCNSKETVATQSQCRLSWPPHLAPGSLQVRPPSQFRLPQSPQFGIFSFWLRLRITKSFLQRKRSIAGYSTKKSNVG